MAPAKKSYGRYEHISDSVLPGPDLPRAPRRMRDRIEIVVAAVPDPNPVGHDRLRRQRVAVNVAQNPLEREYAYGRITTHQYDCGLTFERILERALIGVAAPSMERSCGAGNRGSMIARYLDRARATVHAEHDARSACGQRGAMILRAVIGDRQSFAQIARAERLGKKRGSARIAGEFREALAALVKSGWIDRCGAIRL